MRRLREECNGGTRKRGKYGGVAGYTFQVRPGSAGCDTELELELI
jgi:hypothetical protein